MQRMSRSTPHSFPEPLLHLVVERGIEELRRDAAARPRDEPLPIEFPEPLLRLGAF